MSHLVSFYCDMFRLIFNGSQLMSATPCDMERDMTDPFDDGLEDFWKGVEERRARQAAGLEPPDHY
jgi:hypothetical protein